MGLVEAFGVGRGSNVARGMFIILVYQTTIFDKMLIAGASSITARGAIEKFGQVDVLWSQWFLAYLPCDIIVMFVAWRLALWLYPPETASLPGGAEFLRTSCGRWAPGRLEIEDRRPDAARDRPVDDRLPAPHSGADDRPGHRPARHCCR